MDVQARNIIIIIWQRVRIFNACDRTHTLTFAYHKKHNKQVLFWIGYMIELKYFCSVEIWFWQRFVLFLLFSLLFALLNIAFRYFEYVRLFVWHLWRILFTFNPIFFLGLSYKLYMVSPLEFRVAVFLVLFLYLFVLCFFLFLDCIFLFCAKSKIKVWSAYSTVQIYVQRFEFYFGGRWIEEPKKTLN